MKYSFLLSYVKQSNIRVDKTPVYKAIRDTFANMIVPANYLLDAGVLKVKV